MAYLRKNAYEFYKSNVTSGSSEEKKKKESKALSSAAKNFYNENVHRNKTTESIPSVRRASIKALEESGEENDYTRWRNRQEDITQEQDYLRSLAREAADNRIKSAAERVAENKAPSLRDIAASIVANKRNDSLGNDLLQAPAAYTDRIAKRDAEKISSANSAVKIPEADTVKDRLRKIEQFQKDNGISKIPQSFTTLNPVERRMQIAKETVAAKNYAEKMGTNKQSAQKIQESTGSFTPLEREDSYKLTREGDYAAKHPIGGLVGEVTTNILKAPEAIINIPYQMATGEKLDDSWFRSERENAGFRAGLMAAARKATGGQDDGIRTNSENLSDFLSGTGIDVLNSLANTLVLGGATGNAAQLSSVGADMATRKASEELAKKATTALVTGVAAGSAGDSALREMNKDENISARRAGLAAAAQAVNEGLFERFSIENLQMMKEKPIREVRDVFKNILRSMTVEGSEEAATEIANKLTDQIILGEKSGFSKNYNERLTNLEQNPNLTEGQRKQQALTGAIQDALYDVMMSAAGGALSGVATGASGNLASLIRTTNIGRNIEFTSPEQQREYYENIYDSIDPQAEGAKTLQRSLEEALMKTDGGELLSNVEKGRLDQDIDEFIRVNAEKETPAENEKSEQSEIMPDLIQQENVQEITVPENAAQKLAREMVEGRRKTSEVSETKNLVTNQSATEAAKTAEAESDEILKRQFSSLSEEGRNAAFEIWNNEFKKAEETGSGMRYNLPEFVRAFNTVYDYASHEDSGKVERGMDVLAPAYNLLDEEGFRKAYAAGVHALNARETNILDSMQKVEQVGERKGSVINLTENQTNQLNKIGEFMGKTTGLRFIVTDVKGSRVNGGYIRSAGAIVLNMNSKDAIGTLGHELSHYIQDYAPTDAEMYKTFVVSKMIENGSVEGKNGQKVTFEDLIERKAKAYKDQNLTRDELIDEVVADASTEFLKDENSIRELCRENKSLGEKILDFINDMISAIRDVLGNGSITRDEARLLQKNMDAYEQARQMYVKALKKANDNYKSGTEYKGAQESLNASAEEVAGKVFGEEQAKLQIEHPEEITEEKIENNFKEIATMKPTLHLNGTEFQTYSKSKELQKDMLKFLMESGDSGEFKNPVIGTITATNAGTKYDISHGIGWIKRLTIAAVPDTLRNGKVVRYSPNWKNRGYDSVLLANKITVDKGEHKGDYYVVAVIHSAPDFSRFVLHEARIEKADLGSMFKSGIRHESSTSATTEYPLIKSIFDKLDEINRQSKKEYTKFQIADEDSEGSELTQEQQEYFNDSKVVDKDGRLQVLYHQTANDFTVFDKKHPGAGSTDSETPTGIFMKDTDDNIGLAGSRQMKLYANVTNPLQFRNRSEMKKFWEKNINGYKAAAERIDEIDQKWLPISDKAEAEWDAAYAKAAKATPENEEELDRILDEATEKSDQIIEDWKNEADQARREAKALIDDYIAKSDYDGMIIENDEGSFGRSIKTYIAFDSSQVKDVTNSNPTRDPDIRYQIEDEDSEGNKLTENQQEFFKKSKVRDDQGRLKKMYHGSQNYGFTVFNPKKARSSGYYGNGFYFSDQKSSSGIYGNTYEVYLDIENPLQPGDKNITKAQMRKFIKALAENEDDYGLDNYGYGATVDSVLRSVWGKDDFGMLADLNAAAVGNFTEAVKLFNRVNKTDYDGIIVSTETVAFRSDQIKLTNNQNPTKDPDIRYQIEDEDSEGNKLTEEQQEYFNDSKVVDKDGRLKVMYHGSPNGGFTQFKNHLNFFTADKQYAEEYTHKSGASNPQIYEVYLNIKHPFDIRDPKVKKIFDNEYVKGGWAYSIDPSRAGEKMNTNTGLPDWTEADNIYDFLEENEYLDDYDGIVVDEGNASDGKGGNRPAGVSYITFQSNQAKNTTNMDPTSDPDIRLQLDDVDEEFDVALYKAENDSLRSLNDALQQQITLARGKAVAHADISKVVNSVLSEYESSYRKSTLFQNIAHIYNYLNAGHDPNADTITETMTRLGKAILRESRIKDDTMVKQYADLKKHLKTTAVSLAEKDRPDLDRVGGYQLFVRKNFGKLKITDKGTPVDTIYQELNEQYPEMFPADITSQADRLIQMSEVAESIKPMYSDRFSNADIDELAVVVGQKLLEPYLNAQTAGEAAIEANQVYRERLRAFKNDLREKNQAAIRKVKEESREKIAELRKQYNEAKVADRQAIKEKMDNLRNEKNQKLRAKQERVSQRIQAIKDNNEAAKIRDRVIKNINKMRKTLAEPTDQNHVPEVLRAPVANILSLIDTSSAAIYYKGGVGDMFTYQADAKGKLHKVKVDIDGNVIPGDKSQRTVAWLQAKAFFEQVANSGNMIENEDGTVTYVDLDPSMNFNLNELQRIVEESKKAEEGYKKLDEMNLYELQNVEKVVNALKSMVQYANALRYNEHYKHVDEAADEALKEFQKIGDKKISSGFAGTLQQFLNYDMLDSYTFFSGMGKATESLYQELRNGLDEKTRKVRVATDYMKNLLKETGFTYSDIRKMRMTYGQFSNVKTYRTSGGSIEMTPAEVMSLYMLNKRKQAQGHIYDEDGKKIRNGGFRTENQVVEKKYGKKLLGFDKLLGLNKEVRKSDVVTATRDDIEAICAQLTPQEKKLAEGIGEFFTKVTSDWGNKVSMELYGYNKFGDKNYFPIRTDKNYLPTTTDSLERTQERMLKNMSAAQKTVNHARTPIIVEDIFTVFFRHVDEMSSYNAYVIPISDFQKFYNYRHVQQFDDRGKPVKDDKTVGSVKNEIERAFGAPAKTYIEDLLRDVNGARPGTPQDILEAIMANMKANAVGANVRVAIQQPTAIARAMDVIDAKYLIKGAATRSISEEEWERCKEYAPIAAWKEWGGVGVGAARSMESILLGNTSIAEDMQNLKDGNPEGAAALRSKSMILAEWGDEFTWKRIWMACLAETDDLHKDLEKGSEKYYKQAAKRFNQIIDQTQVVDSPFNRTAIMKKKGLSVIYTPFMAEPSKSYNMLYRAYRSGDRKKIGKAVAVFLINAALTAVAQSTWDAIRRRDKNKDKNYLERWIAAFPDNFIDDANVAKSIPYVQDIIETLSGETVARQDLTAFSSLFKMGQEVAKFYEGKSKYTTYGFLNKTMEPLSVLSGIPANNLLRDAGAIVDNILELTGARGLEYAKGSVLYAKDTDAGMQMFIPEAMAAYIHKDQARGDQIIDELTRYNGSKVASKAKTWLKMQPDIIQAAEAKRTGDFEKYEKIVKNYVDLGINRNWVIGAISNIKGPEEGEEPSPMDRLMSFAGRVGKTSIGSYEEQEPAEEKDLNLYSGKDVAAAVGGYSEEEIKSAQDVVDQMAADYRETGKTNADAKEQIKKAIKAKYQQEFKQMDLTGRRQMINALKKLSIGSMKIFVEDDFKGNKSGQWLYEEKKKK